LDRQKNAAIPAIRGAVNETLTKKVAVFRHFIQLSALSLCQVPLFHFREKTALACGLGQSQKGLSERESALGAREKSSLGRRDSGRA
jgi:hypothetical protein